MKELFTAKQQLETFERAQSLFLEGQYVEAEALFRLVIESATQQQDYQTYVKALIFLNRLFVNTMQFEQMHSFLLLIAPFIDTYGSQEDALYYRLLKIIFNNYYLIGDTLSQHEQLFEDALQSKHTHLAFLIGSNLLLRYIEKGDFTHGLQLLERLNTSNMHSPSPHILYSHWIYAFLLYFAKEDYEKCAVFMNYMEQSALRERFFASYHLCKGLLEAQRGNLTEAKTYFHLGVEQSETLAYIRLELKLWIQTLKKFQLHDEIIVYQDRLIELLDVHYNTEMSAMRKKSMEEMSQQYYEWQIYIDQLTNVKNRNYYEHLLKKQQQVKNYTVAVLDIDHFKHINDTYGHPVGDEAIQFVAQHLNTWNPRHDIAIIRYGGDEFVLLMPYPFASVKQELELLHEQMMHTPFTIEKTKQPIPISISIGVGYTTNTYCTIDALFQLADTAIYEAKKARGQMVIACIETTKKSDRDEL